MGEISLPLAGFFMTVCTAACGAVVFLWRQSTADRRDAASALASVRAEVREDIKRIHERLDDLGKERVDMGDIDALRADMRQIASRLDQLNSNFLKFMAASHAAE